MVLLLYPVFYQYLSVKETTEQVVSYERFMESVDDEKADRIINGAYDFNEKVYKTGVLFHDLSDEELNTYNNTLVLYEDVMGHIEIPSIDVSAIIYHGSGDKVLEKGVGHIESTSLPVNGKSVHSFLLAHSGIPTNRLFTDLDKLKTGDIFYIKILNRKYTYKVVDISVKLPQEMEETRIIDNKNLVTLVTCTPYGVNTHRLLVTGELIKEDIKTDEITKVIPHTDNIIKYISNNINTEPAIVVVIIFFTIFIVYIIIQVCRKKRYKK